MSNARKGRTRAPRGKGSGVKIGLKPGSVVYVGPPREGAARIRMISYGPEVLQEQTWTSLEVLPEQTRIDPEGVQDKTLTSPGARLESPAAQVRWIDLVGIHDTPAVEALGTRFGLAPLILEDVVNTGHRPKLERMDGLVVVILKMLQRRKSAGTDDAPDSGGGRRGPDGGSPNLKDGDGRVTSEQVSICFGPGFVLTLQEVEGDVFDGVRRRLKENLPRVRFLDADYLAYALMDAVVDHYFLVLEQIGDEIEELEEELIADPTAGKLEILRRLRREMVSLRRAIWPLREVVGGLERVESSLISQETLPYLRDLYEHVIQVLDTVEGYRESVTGLMDLYLSGVSNRMNEVMKVLTIIATIFIPLGFLAGVYGMNFDPQAGRFNMPELGFPYAYPLFWLAVILIAGGLLWFFRRKRWL